MPQFLISLTQAQSKAFWKVDKLKKDSGTVIFSRATLPG
jgi:hypothetical protein